MEQARLLGHPFAGREKKRSLGIALEQRYAVEADVIDIHTVRQITTGELGTEFHFAVVPVSIQLHRGGNRLTGRDE